MTVDIAIAGWRFYLNLNKPEPVAKSNTAPPTTLSTPMQVHSGSVGYYQTRAADETTSHHGGAA